MPAGSCIRATIGQCENETLKVARNAFNIGRSGTQYVAMVTKLSSSYCGEPLVESYCKESDIFDTNWLGYLFSSYLIKIRLRV